MQTSESPTDDPHIKMHRLIRDGVRNIIAGQLDSVTTPRDLDMLLAQTLEFITSVAADIGRKDGSDQAVACAAGCSMCCYNFEVHVSPLEAIRLADHILHSLPPDVRDDIIATIERIADQKEQADDEGFPLYPCPLLNTDNGRCRVYGKRPLVCRAHNSIDIKACEARHASGHEQGNTVLGSATHRLTGQATLAGLRAALLDRVGDDLVIDLTHGIALLIRDPGLMQRALSDPMVLASAEVKRQD